MNLTNYLALSSRQGFYHNLLNVSYNKYGDIMLAWLVIIILFFYEGIEYINSLDKSKGHNQK